LGHKLRKKTLDWFCCQKGFRIGRKGSRDYRPDEKGAGKSEGKPSKWGSGLAG